MKNVNENVMSPDKNLNLVEFSALMAFLISIVSMSTNIMLPVIDTMGLELGAEQANDSQQIILFLYIGLACGQLVYGPLSDTIGRRRAMFSGLIIFIVGTMMAIFAKDFNSLLLGRVVQGVGIAAPRIVSVAIVRDLYSGRVMAQISSIILGFFILVPAIAPALGQGILQFYEWQMTFYVLILQAIVCLMWYGFRQPETLSVENRRALSFRNISQAVVEIAKNRISFWYTIATGLVFGSFMGYVITSPQMFSDLFGIKDKFPFYFGSLALIIGVSSIFNARLVVWLGMRRLCIVALALQVTISTLFLVLAAIHGGILSLHLFMVWASATFFFMGFIFGNFNAIAMEPLGHIAGVGAAFIGGISTFISLGVAGVIGKSYHGSVTPIIGGFVLLGFGSIILMVWADRPKKAE